MAGEGGWPCQEQAAGMGRVSRSALASFCRACRRGGNAPAALRHSPKVNLCPWLVLGAYFVSERCCHGGKKKLKNSWFYSVSVKTDFKETSEQKLTVWNIWTFFRQSNLLTSIRISRSLLRCCFQAWYKTREKLISERKITPLESLLPVAHFCPPKLRGSGAAIAEVMGRKAV